MEYIDHEPEADWPWTVFDPVEGFIIDKTETYQDAVTAYGTHVVILKTYVKTE